ncbi:MAG TPA: glycosyl hydrolase family 18 protein [Anaeromyxobacteraceae bacterium]|nr:glycosyl hydrolase family 18 protein [Anaeromyxobacteraceae bacterium]
MEALRRNRVAVSVSPSSASLPAGATASFSANVTGTTNTGVTWSVQEGATGGTIGATGVYTSPSSPGTYHVVATSQADTSKSATATVTVTAVTSTTAAVGVAVSPASATLAASAVQAFTATVSGTTNTGVTWSIQEGAAGGTVSASGAYTAPATGGTYHVVATSQADATKSAIATVTVSAPASTTTSSAWVSGYYAGYQSSLYTPAQVDFSAITHLLLAAAQPRADGTIDTAFYLDAVSGPALAQDLSTRAHAAGRKAIIMLGGAGAETNWEGACSSSNIAGFVQNLLNMVQTLGYDGLDLDWEPISDADKPLIISLVQRLRAAAPNLILTFPVGFVNANFGPDPWFAQLAPYLDQMNIMTYGMADAWPGWLSWHGSALDGASGSYPSSVSSSANGYAALGIPKSRIGVGTGFYGSCWRGPTGPRQSAGSGVIADDNVMSYANIMASYYSAAAYHWDSVASEGYLSFAQATGPQGCTFVSYEDGSSIAAKGQWVRANGFGGTIIWTVNQGYIASSGTNPPLQAVKAAFLQ